MTPDEDFLSFIAEGLRIFGPTCRVRVQVRIPGGEYIGAIAFPADRSWRPPAKQFRDTRNTARSNRRGERNGKGKTEGKSEGSKSEGRKAAQGSKEAAERSIFDR